MKTILVPVDFSDTTEKVIELVKTLAGSAGSRVVLLHVRQADPLVGGMVEEQLPMTPSSFVPSPPMMGHTETPAKIQQQLDALKLRFAECLLRWTRNSAKGFRSK